jgi:hypothetical protein
MACCGPNIEFNNGKKLLTYLRSLDKMNINIDLEPIYNLDFLADKGEWKPNFPLNESIIKSNENESEIKQKLNGEIESMEHEILELKKEYCAKFEKLLLLVQTHCQIKKDILDEFKKISGIETDKIFEDGEVIVDHNYQIHNEEIEDYIDDENIIPDKTIMRNEMYSGQN